MGNIIKSFLDITGNTIDKLTSLQVAQTSIANEYNTVLSTPNKAVLEKGQKESLGTLFINGVSREEIKKIKREYRGIKREMLDKMDNQTDKFTKFKFDNIATLDLELEIRTQIIESITRLESAWNNNGNSIANYPDNNGFYLPTEYWNLEDPNQIVFTLNNNITPFDGINSILEVGSGSKLDCNRMANVIIYHALAKTLNRDNFNALFSNSTVYITEMKQTHNGNSTTLLDLQYVKKQAAITRDMKNIDYVPGDLLYLRNSSTYKKAMDLLGINEAWSGEFCFYVGKNRYAGFGLGGKKGKRIEKMVDELFEKCKEMYIRYRKALANGEITEGNIYPPAKTDVRIDADVWRINISSITQNINF